MDRPRKQTLHLLAQIQTNHTPDHQLSIQNSLVGDSSGDGLFLEKGTLHPGSVVALYPGTALFHEEISFFGGVHHMFPEDEALSDKNGVYLILPWHFKEFFLNSEKFKNKKMIFPLPHWEIYND